MFNAQLTQDYAIQSDATAQNFVVKRRRIVDPTRAPGYKPDPAAPAPELSERWEDAAYYPVNTDGLRAALDYVRFRAAVDADTTTLAEFIAALRAETSAIEAALDSRLPYWPEVTVELTGKRREISADTAA